MGTRRYDRPQEDQPQTAAGSRREDSGRGKRRNDGKAASRSVRCQEAGIARRVVHRQRTPAAGLGHQAELQDAEGVRHDGVVCVATNECADQSRPRRVVMGGTGEGLEPAQPPVVSACRKTASLASVALVMVSCDAASVPEVAEVPLTPLASSSAPLARGGAIALATEETACVIDTYRTRVHCIHRHGEQTHVFGQRGQGPGEFPYTPQRIVRGPDGTVGVIGMRKMAMFEPSGLLVTEVGLPGRVRPAGTDRLDPNGRTPRDESSEGYLG